jgi:two-component system, NarL family, sensor histidine kinase LiaS
MGSIRVRLLIISLVTTLLAATTVVAIAYFESVDNYVPELREVATSYLVYRWQGGDSSVTSDSFPEIAKGYVVDADNKVLYSLEPACQVGSPLEMCLEGAANLTETNRILQQLGERFLDFRESLQQGSSVVVRLHLKNSFAEVLNFFWYYLRLIIISAVPIALLLSFAIARPVIRRLQRMAEVSRQFGKGDLSVRTSDGVFDEIGQVGRQFDAMASTIGSQVQQLRQLAEENSQLALAAEKNARRAERASLSRDLHDSVSQHLFSLAMGTSKLATQIRRDPDKAATQAEQLADIAGKAQDELRSVLTQLRPSRHEGGLLESLHSLIAAWRIQTGLEVQTRLQPLVVPIMLSDVIYRVTQEALNNIARHANAKHVTVVLQEKQHELELTVADDGQGFDPQQGMTGLGLVGMRERVQSVGGTVVIESTEKGTAVQVKFPFVKSDEETILPETAKGAYGD